MVKRKISKASKRRLGFFGPICVFIVLYSIFNVLYNTYTILSLTKEKKEMEIKYEKLQKESENLKIDIEKLTDDTYLANYAREHYLYSKDGEYILKIIEEEQEDRIDSISTQINKNYAIIILSVIMLIIFIYVLSKGKKKETKV